MVPTEPGGAVLCVVGLGEQGLDGMAALPLLGEVIAVGDLVEISGSRGGHGVDRLGTRPQGKCAARRLVRPQKAGVSREVRYIPMSQPRKAAKVLEVYARP